MDYEHREEIKGESGREPTAFTMKTIKELLEEEQEQAQAQPKPRAQPAPIQEPPARVQSPPQMQNPAPVAPARRATDSPARQPAGFEGDVTVPPTPPVIADKVMNAAPEAAPERKSFLGRLIGR